MRDFVGHGRAMPGSTRSHHSQNDVGPFLWIGDQLGGNESASISAFASRRSLIRSPALRRPGDLRGRAFQGGKTLTQGQAGSIGGAIRTPA